MTQPFDALLQTDDAIGEIDDVPIPEIRSPSMKTPPESPSTPEHSPPPAWEDAVAPFLGAFETDGLPVPGYLCLLGLHRSDEVAVVMDRIAKGLGQEGHQEALQRFLTQPNWRPHVVAALAMMIMDDPSPQLGALWGAIEAGSWVSPQLLVVASMCDADFLARAKARAAVGFEVRLRRPTADSTIPRPRSAKELAALLAICDSHPGWRAWSKEMRDDPEVVDLLAQDIDHGGDIAAAWLTRLQQVMAQRRASLAR